MKTIRLLAGLVLAAALYSAVPAKADTVSANIGTQNFTSGTKITTVGFLAATLLQPAPFNGFCGTDILGNCSASWTFNYAVPVGDTITGATLSLGIYDLDSAAAGNQIASFTLNGVDDLTTTINTVSEALDGTGSPNSFYDVLTIVIPGADLVDLAGGSATFSLKTQAPGLGILGNTLFNGVGLDFSSLSLTVTPGTTTPPPPMPEPSSLALCLAGVAAVGLAKVLLHR